MYANLVKHHRKNHTHPKLEAILLRGIYMVLYGHTPPTVDDFPSSSDLIEHQHMIGWKHIFCGRFVSEWHTLKDAHLQTVPEKESHHSGSTWVIG